MIKCSSCGVDIDILQLADHVCAPSPMSSKRTRKQNCRYNLIDRKAATAAPAMTPPESPKLDRAGSLGSFSKRAEGPAPNGRMRAPPRIDSNAASETILQRRSRSGNANLYRQALSSLGAVAYEQL